MARAAAKRRQTPRPETSARRPKGGGGESYESTLFFSRLRRQAKWVFVLLALVFGGGFVIFGVGSDIGGGLGDIFRDSGGGGNTPSISKALKQTQARPKDPAAWRALAEAYETDGNKNGEAIDAWTRFTQLRPKVIDGYSHLAALYETKANRQTDDARNAQYEVLAAQQSTFLPPTSSPLGRALAERPDPISQAIAARANERYNTAIEERQATLLKLVNVYTQLATLQPDEPAMQLQLATAAQNAGDAQTAIQAWRQFLELAPDAPEAPYAKQQIKALEQQLGQ
jgi:tetratricopeptide (TPR) repeat protein